jgi:hypothetical protein
MTTKQPKSLWPDWGTTEDGRQYAPAAERNKDFLLAELKKYLPKQGTVLEIASGTGEQAVYFTPQLRGLKWLPSDYEDDKLISIAAWQKHVPCDRVLPPLKIDTSETVWPCEDQSIAEQTGQITSIVCINMIHIAPWAAGLGLLAGAGRILPSDGTLFFYGPYMSGGKHTAPSNQAFDKKLKDRDPSWGLRDIDDVVAVATTHGLHLNETIAMPANNFVLVFEKQ